MAVRLCWRTGVILSASKIGICRIEIKARWAWVEIGCAGFVKYGILDNGVRNAVELRRGVITAGDLLHDGITLDRNRCNHREGNEQRGDDDHGETGLRMCRVLGHGQR